MKRKIKAIVVMVLSLCVATCTTGCLNISDILQSMGSISNDSNKMKFVNSQMDDYESQMMYVTSEGPQEMADKVFDIIISCESVDELMGYRTVLSNNVNRMRCKDVLEALDGNIDNEECVFIDVKCSENDELLRYSIDAYYYLTVDGNEYVLFFSTVIVSEYESFKHGLHSLQIMNYADYKPNNHRKDYVTPEEAMGHPALVFNTPVTAKHNETIFTKGNRDNTQYDGRRLMEEVLYLIEENEEEKLKDLYAKVNVNGENMDEISKNQVAELLDVMGGKDNLEAAGGIVCSPSFDLEPVYVDCEGIDYPTEYGMRYIIEVDGVKHKLQIVYVSSEDKTMPEDYVGIQSITFVE